MGIFNTPFSNAWSINCEGVPIAVISTVNCDGVTMYHLSVGISARVYTFSLVPTDKWYMVTPSHFTVLISAMV